MSGNGTPAADRASLSGHGTPAAHRAPAGASPSRDLDRFVARLLTIGTYVSVALLACGVVLMLAAGISPLQSGYPAFKPASLLDDVRAARPEGFLWLGLVAVVMTPASRVIASLVGYVREGDRRMAVIAVGILAVIVTSVLSAIATGG